MSGATGNLTLLAVINRFSHAEQRGVRILMENTHIFTHPAVQEHVHVINNMLARWHAHCELHPGHGTQRKARSLLVLRGVSPLPPN